MITFFFYTCIAIGWFWRFPFGYRNYNILLHTEVFYYPFLLLLVIPSLKYYFSIRLATFFMLDNLLIKTVIVTKEIFHWNITFLVNLFYKQSDCFEEKKIRKISIGLPIISKPYIIELKKNGYFIAMQQQRKAKISQFNFWCNKSARYTPILEFQNKYSLILSR